MKYAVAREEKTLGSYTREDILTYSKTGQILPSDKWYNVDRNQWEPIAGFANSNPQTNIPQTKGKSPLNTILGITLAIVLVVLAGATVTYATKPTPPNAEDIRSSAEIVGERLIKDHLKAPSTAVFSPKEETYSSLRKDGNYTVGGYVDSQNSFGAMLRAKWKAVLHKNNETWILLWYRIGDDESGDFPDDK